MIPMETHENVQRGSRDFPLDYHYIDKRHSRYQMPYHWHGEVEILHVLSGAFTLSVDGRSYALRADDAAYIAPGLLHGGEPDDCVYECVVFDMRLLLKSNDHCRRFIGAILDGAIVVEPCLPAGSRVTSRTILPMFDALREQRDGYALITLGCLFQFVGEVYKFHSYRQGEPGSTLGSRRAIQLKPVFEMIESRFADPPTLAELSAAAGMTPKYFCRVFKAATHRTPIDYLSYYRIEQACYAFAATDRSVTEIAYELGYSDLNYFIRCFRKHKHITPGRYRARGKG